MKWSRIEHQFATHGAVPATHAPREPPPNGLFCPDLRTVNSDEAPAMTALDVDGNLPSGPISWLTIGLYLTAAGCLGWWWWCTWADQVGGVSDWAVAGVDRDCSQWAPIDSGRFHSVDTAGPLVASMNGPPTGSRAFSASCANIRAPTSLRASPATISSGQCSRSHAGYCSACPSRQLSKGPEAPPWRLPNTLSASPSMCCRSSDLAAAG